MEKYYRIVDKEWIEAKTVRRFFVGYGFRYILDELEVFEENQLTGEVEKEHRCPKLWVSIGKKYKRL